MSKASIAEQLSAEEMQSYFMSAQIWQGICSGDIDLVRSLLRQVDPDELVTVYGRVQTQLSHRLETPCLDSAFQQNLKDMRIALGTLFKDVQSFNYRKSKIFEMPDNYARYHMEMELYGQRPDHYLTWLEKRGMEQSVVR